MASLDRYGVGAYDYVLTIGQNGNDFRSQSYTDVQIAYFEDYPILPAVMWTIGVWTVRAAAILLRSRWATPVAVVAVVSQLGLDLITLGFLDRWQLFGPGQSVFDLGSWPSRPGWRCTAGRCRGRECFDDYRRYSAAFRLR